MDTARHDRELVRTFSRRMLPLAILFGSLVVLAPTLLMAGLDFERARARSDLYARNLAHEVAKDASRHPYVWRWRIDKVVEGTLAEKEIQHLVYLRVEDCDSEVIFEHGKPAGWPYTWMTSKAKVVTTGGELGTLWVALNPEAASPGRLLIACLSLLIGLLSGLALYHFPVRIVRRQAHAIEETTTHLVHTRLELHQTNLTLQERVVRRCCRFASSASVCSRCRMRSARASRASCMMGWRKNSQRFGSTSSAPCARPKTSNSATSSRAPRGNVRTRSRICGARSRIFAPWRSTRRT